MESVLANLLGVDAGVVVVVVIVFLVAGPQIPKIARGLGQAKNEFEKGQKGDKAEEAKKKAEDEDKSDS